MAFRMYISVSGEDRIARYEVNADTGALTHMGDTRTAARPAPLAVNPRGGVIYAGCRDANVISSYGVGGDGALTHIADAAVDTDPCYLATDRGGRFLLSAYYEGGRCAVHRIDERGAVALRRRWSGLRRRRGRILCRRILRIGLRLCRTYRGGMGRTRYFSFGLMPKAGASRPIRRLG